MSDSSVSDSAARVWDSLRRRGDDIIDQRITNPDNVETIVKKTHTQIETRNGTPLFERRPQAKNVLKPEAPDARAAAKEGVEATSGAIRTSLRESLELSPETIARLNKAIEDGNLLEGDLRFFNGDRIDWDAMAEGDSLKRLLLTFEDILETELRDVNRGVQSHADIQRLAKMVGVSAEKAHGLFSDLTAGHGLSARMLAAHQTMLASGDRLRVLARVAKESGSNADRLAVHRHVEMHAMLMAEIKGSGKEIARAQGSMRIMKESSEESFKEFDDILRVMGSHKNHDKLLDTILQARNIDELSVLVQRTAWQTIRDGIIEVGINGLLSGLRTHMINLSSNFGQLFLGAYDKYVAAAIGRSRKFAGIGQIEQITLREANIDFTQKVSSISGAFRLGGQAFREGRPITDVRQRIEFDSRKVIQSDREDFIGTTINAVGDLIRVPARGLIAGDEVFKYMNREAETASLAYRQAWMEADTRGLTGTKREAYIIERSRKLYEEPTPEIQQLAVERARYYTFQESSRTVLGGPIEKVIATIPIVKFIVSPFVRTNLNILRQAFIDRTPLGLFMKEIRGDILRGGVAGDIAIARMTMGTGAMITGYVMMDKLTDPESQVQVVGKRSFNNSEVTDQVKDYSISFDFGKNWAQYHRFDPIGSWLAWSADLYKLYNEHYDPDDPDSVTRLEAYTTAALGAYISNAMNKTYMKSLNDLIDGFERIAEGTPQSRVLGTQKLIADQLQKLIPFSSAVRSLTAEIDPVVRDGWTIGDRLQELNPWMSDGLPPVRDMLGRTIDRNNAKFYWINPFATNPESDDVLDQELSDLAFDIPRLPKSLDSGATPLNSLQYSEFKRLIGQADLGGGQTIEDVLRELVQTDSYQSVNDVLRVEMIKSILEQSKSLATELLRQQFPELRKAQLESIREVGEARAKPREEDPFRRSQ